VHTDTGKLVVIAIIKEPGDGKVCARWVLKMLTTEHKTAKKNIYAELLHHSEKDGDAFMSRIITSDETWVHHYNPQTKMQSME
jgi:hypothetical protein